MALSTVASCWFAFPLLSARSLSLLRSDSGTRLLLIFDTRHHNLGNSRSQTCSSIIALNHELCDYALKSAQASKVLTPGRVLVINNMVRSPRSSGSCSCLVGSLALLLSFFGAATFLCLVIRGSSGPLALPSSEGALMHMRRLSLRNSTGRALGAAVPQLPGGRASDQRG